MLNEFKKFIAKGNMLDMAVGIVIGAAFTAIVTSAVKDLVTPIIGMFGKWNFDNLFLVLREGNLPGPYGTPQNAANMGAITLNYGNFITALINFLLVGFVLFMIVRAANKIRKEEPPAAPPEPSNEEKLLTEIRDLLKAK